MSGNDCFASCYQQNFALYYKEQSWRIGSNCSKSYYITDEYCRLRNYVGKQNLEHFVAGTFGDGYDCCCSAITNIIYYVGIVVKPSTASILALMKATTATTSATSTSERLCVTILLI